MARKVLEGIGYTALGFGFLFQAAKALELFGMADGNGKVFSGPMAGRAGKPLRGLAGPESEAMQRAGGVIKSVTTRTVGDIRDRISYIQAQIRKDSLKPDDMSAALEHVEQALAVPAIRLDQQYPQDRRFFRTADYPQTPSPDFAP